jgi:flagellar M-ring protein FliF
VASNLPDGDAAEGAGGSQSQNAETRTVTNFEVSEIIRDIERQPGAVRRLTVAVLVNRGVIAADPDAVAAELDDVRELVAASVGFDEARGDAITVKAMAFEPVAELGTQAARNGFGDVLAENPMRLLQLGVLALVTIILAVFVIRPILASRRRPVPTQVVDSAPQLGSGAVALPDGRDLATNVDQMGGAEKTVGDTSHRVMALPPAQGEATDGSAAVAEDPVKRLKSMIEARQPDTLAILRNWLEDEKTGEKV